MGLIPKVKYGDIEETRVIDDQHTITEVSRFNAGTLSATRTVIREHTKIPYNDTAKAGEILSKLYSDPLKLLPTSRTEVLKSHKDAYFLITEYTILR